MSSQSGFLFEPCRVQTWSGRYSRIEGEGGCFHLRWDGSRFWPLVVWWREGLKLTSWCLPGEQCEKLASAVATAKFQLGGREGGGFLINEFGQVLVPAPRLPFRCVLAGRVEGLPRFEDPERDGTVIDLGGDEGLECGDVWPLPYLGMRYNLHRDGFLYYYRIDRGGGKVEPAPCMDRRLILLLRRIRPTGPARVIVNPAGIVLTKRPPDDRAEAENEDEDETWIPTYVGRVDLSQWFHEER